MRSIAILGALFPAWALAATGELSPSSKIDAVTVYQSSARVSRAARVELPAGDVRVKLSGLSDQLVDDSLRVQGAGTAKAKVFGISVERMPRAEAAAADVRAAQEKVAKLSERDRTLGDEIKAANSRREFVDSLRSTYSRERAENMAVRATNPKEWEAMIELVGRQYGAVADQIRKAELARKELAKQLSAAQAELDKLQAKGSLVTKTVAIELRAERGGSFEIELSYLIPTASWQPIWDARLDPEKPTVDLALYGSVQQSSGEDWSNVKLAVSTAQPSRGLYLPELSPQYLEKLVAPPPRPSRPSHRGGMAAPSAPAMARAVAPSDEEDSEKPAIALEQAEAEVSQGLLSTTFTAPRRETVEGTGKARKAFLASFPLKAELIRTAVPKIEQQAFLSAKANNESGIPLLAGSANVFLGDEFVGRTTLPLVAAGDEVKLAFGSDDRIKVERKVVDRKHETAGLISKEELYRFVIRTTVKSLYPKPATITLVDQVPVSRDEDIKVKVLDASTKPTEPEDPMKPGQRVYKLSLHPKAEQVITQEFEVRFPRGQPIRGMD